MDATLTKEQLNTTALNAFDIGTVYMQTIRGSHRTRETFSTTMPGGSKRWNTVELGMPGMTHLVAMPYSITLPGVRRRLETFNATTPGGFALAVIHVTLELPGASKHFSTYNNEVPGVGRVYNNIEITAPGKFRTLTVFNATLPGGAKHGLGHAIVFPGRHGVAQPDHLRVYRQGYRVAEDALARWELYLGYGAMPDFDVAPAATGTTLPIVFTPTYPGAGLTTILHAVVRESNAFGLLTFNQYPALLEIDENGAEVLGPITEPELARVLDGAAVGGLQVWARYPHEGDRNPADQWELYAEVGADPVVGVDTPVLTAAMGITGAGRVPWHGVAEGLTPGAAYHVKVVGRRLADDAYAESSVLQITLAVVYDLDAGEAAVFAGAEYEIKQ